MIALKTAARPYAKAIFQLACEQNRVSEWMNILNLLTLALKTTNLSKIFKNPSYSAEEKVDFLMKIFSEAVKKQDKVFFTNLANNKRLGLIPYIDTLFHQLKTNFEKVVDVNLTSAFGLSTKQSTELTTTLSKKINRAVYLTYKVDKSLIGGVVIRIGDSIVDASIRGRITRLSKLI